MKKLWQGIIIGIANAIPGVSGATLALILGCYDELLSISSKPYAIKIIWKERFLLLGIIIGIVLSVFLLSYLYQHYPLLTTCYFVGLIIGGLPGFLQPNERIAGIYFFLFGIGLFLVILIDMLASQGTKTSIEIPSIIFAGILSSFAMILPGVSGSMMLLALGNYFYLLGIGKNFLEALMHFQIPGFSTIITLLVFGISFVLTLIGFSNLIKSVRKNHHVAFSSFSMGLIIGSLIIIIFALPYKEHRWAIPLEISVGVLIGLFTMIGLKIILFKKEKKTNFP